MSSTNSIERRCAEVPVLLVDDEASFRLSLAELLREDGHHVLDCPSATAVPPFDRLPAGIVLVTDFEMPGSRNGVELADAFRQARPVSPAILLSAYTIPTLVGVNVRPWLRFVAKPLDYDVLHALLHDLV